MPIEIRELIIRAVATGQAGEPDGQGEREERPGQLEPAHDTQAIVQECVRQVLRILQQSKER